MKRNAKQSSRGSSSGRGSRLRLFLLLATVAAFLLVPAAQAFANGEFHLTIKGHGSGTIESLGPEEGEGTPKIECSYASPGPQTGVCTNELELFEGEEFIGLGASPSGSSDMRIWTIEEGEGFGGCGEGFLSCFVGYHGVGLGNVKVTALFCIFGEPTAECEEEGPIGPVLTVVKEGTGEGTVVSSPAGIECGGTCSKDYLENTIVTLTASPAVGSSFTSWKKCDAKVEVEPGKFTGVEGRKCTVKMSIAKTVGAKFSPTKNLALSKSGPGTVSGGAVCDANCASTTVAIAEGKATTLTAKVAKEGSEFKEWKGACAGEGLVCPLTMSADKTTEAVFTAIEKVELTVNKSGGGSGTVKSTPTPTTINCGTSCSSSTSLFYKGKEVVLTASVLAGKGSTLGNWSGGGCSGTEATPCTVSMSAAKTVTATFE